MNTTTIIKQILRDNLKLINEGIEYLGSDEYKRNKEEFDKWLIDNEPGKLNLTADDKYNMSQRQIDELKESIKVANNKFYDDRIQKRKELRAYEWGDYQEFLNNDYDTLPTVIRNFIYEILDSTDSYNRMYELQSILEVLLWEDVIKD